MSYSSLADFLEELAAHGEMARVTAEVDPALEIAEITRRVARVGGPALLFDRVRGQTTAVVTNLLGTEARACRALGLESLDRIVQRTEALIEEHTPQNWFDRLRMTGDEAGAQKFRAKTLKSGACQQVVRLGRDVDLAALPLLTQWPGESGRAITAGRLVTQDRASEARSVTICTLQALDANRLAILDDGHSGFARQWDHHLAVREKMPVAVVLGGDPAGMIAANVELPDEIDAYHMAGLMRGRAVELVPCRTHAMEVPADADFVFEGYLDPDTAPVAVESAALGGNHYRVARPAAVLQVAAITHRSHPIFPAWIDSGPEGETGVLFDVRRRMVLPALRSAAPEIVDLHLPALGGPHRFAFLSLHKRYPFHARQVASAVWGSAALKFTKFLVLVDAQVNVHDVTRVLSEMGANVAPERDVFFHDGPAHGSDHANGFAPLGRHVAIDATAKIAGEQSGHWPSPLEASEEIRQLVDGRWAEYQLDPQRHVKSF